MKVIWSLLLAGCYVVMCSVPVYADTVVVPSDINISATQGEEISKTLQISTDVPLTSLQIIPSDLERVDHKGRILSSNVQIDLPQTKVDSNQVVQSKLSVDGDLWTQSGEFNGSLLIKYNGGQQVVPVTIRVKDRIGIPLIFLIIGVALGLGLTWYQTNGLKRDDLAVQMGNLRIQMRGEPEFSEGGCGQEFKQRIESHLIEVESALTDRVWEAAEAESTQARAVWRRWRKWREDWITQLKYQQTLLIEVEKLKGFRLGKDLEIELDNIKRQMVDDPSPEEFRTKLLRCRNQIEQVLQAKARIDALETGIRELPETERDSWRARRDQLKTDLTRLSLDETKLLEETESFKQWQGAIENLERDLAKAVEAQSSKTETESTVKIAERMAYETGTKWTPLSSSPIVRPPFDNPNNINQAQFNLRLFRWSIQGIALVFLAWAGLNNLYSQNPTFGADRSKDYFALLAWGFGAEVTRESVVKTIRGFGVSVGAPEDAK